MITSFPKALVGLEMRMITLNWENAHLYKDLWISHHRFRHRIFVDRLNWSVQSYHDIEFDQFDTPSAQYVICIKDDNTVCGVTRLLPTTRPYMIQCLWPGWLKGPLPQSKSIWEATRFGCCQSLSGDERAEVILTLIESCISFGLDHDISSYLAVMPLQLYRRVLRPAGCELRVLTGPQNLGGMPCAIAEIAVSTQILRHVQARRLDAVTEQSSFRIISELAPFNIKEGDNAP